jgi:hypothetical protein
MTGSDQGLPPLFSLIRTLGGDFTRAFAPARPLLFRNSLSGMTQHRRQLVADDRESLVLSAGDCVPARSGAGLSIIRTAKAVST